MKIIDDLWVNIHFKEDSIPSLRGGTLTSESIADIKSLILEELRKKAENSYTQKFFKDGSEEIVANVPLSTIEELLK